MDAEPPRRYRFADLELDEGRQRVLRDGQEVPLPKLSFDLLLVLLESAPNYLSNSQLMARVWPGLVIGDKTVTQRVKLLRDALGDDHDEPRYIAGLRGRGYRIQVPVTQVAPPPPTGVPVTADVEPQHLPGSASDRWRARRVAAIAALPVFALLAWWLWSTTQHADRVESNGAGADTDSRATAISIAVLPFRDLGGDAVDIAQGVPEAVLDALSTQPGLTVIARSSSFRAAEQNRSVQDIGGLLGVSYLVEGSVQRAGDTLRVSAQLVDTAAGTQVWAASFDRDVSDIFGIQDEIAASVATALGERTGNPDSPDVDRPTENVDAYLEYLRGRRLLGRWTGVDAEAAARAFESAIELDPGFGAAYALLYEARLMAADRRCSLTVPLAATRDDPGCRLSAARAEQQPLIDKALALDPHSGAAYFARAIWADGESASREEDFSRGLELGPSNGRGMTAYAEFLDREGRADEAERLIERAIRVDPLSPRAHFWRMRRKAGMDVTVLEAGMLGVLEVDADYVPALQRYAKYRWLLHGELAQAIRLIEHALTLDPASPWLRHTAMAMYLDIDDVDAARALQREAGETGSVGSILMLLHEGDADAAAIAALDGLGFAAGVYENWGLYDALRSRAMTSGNYAASLDYLLRNTQLGLQGTEVALENFRAVPAVAQLLILADRDEDAHALLRQCIRWIDDVHLPTMGSVFALRIKAQSLLLLGDTDAALDVLEASFAARDFVQWWYTIDHDPLWRPLHDDPRFGAIASRVRQQVGEQRRALEELRTEGAVPRRGVEPVSAANALP